VNLSEFFRDWSKSYRDRGKYTPVGVAFHWTMAALVIYQLLSGWWMQRYLVGAEKLDAYARHSAIGLTLLLLGALRLSWRLMVPGPINDADNQGWRSNVAHTIHGLFYTLFVVMPLSGYMMWSAIQPARPLYIAGLVKVPVMPFQDLSPEWQFWVLETAMDIHVFSVVVLAVLIPAHAAAAVKHHFWDRDDVFEGMLPEVPDTKWSLADAKRKRKEEQSPPRPEAG
jgi:cytochrome b561